MPRILSTFAAHFASPQYDNMDNIHNTRGKGYCMLYILMGLFFFISLILMLCNRSVVIDFPK